jgi:phytanoyl-CoA hydroxylase
LQKSLSESPFHSAFGGTWIDRADFPIQLAARLADGRLSREIASDISNFERDGFVIFENAASDDDLRMFETSISSAFREGHEHLISQLPGSGSSQPVTRGMDRKGTRIVDSFAVIPSALNLLSTLRLSEFIGAIFEEQPLLFQSISFDMGSGQGLHQDTAYVVVNRPMELLACWIALEDVRIGSGELQYLVGSHRLPDFNFGGNRKHWRPEEDGIEAHNRWIDWILSEGKNRGLRTNRFLAKRADILVWHADLAHGGSPITNTALTRKSLVGHYCPVSAYPHFMQLSPERRTKRRHGDISYASWHYDLANI